MLGYHVYGVNGAQSLLEADMPVSELQRLYKGADYPPGPQDTHYWIDDASSESNGDLIYADGSAFVWAFTPLLPDGTPV